MAKYHIRVPMKATAVFKFDRIPEGAALEEFLRQKFDEGKYLLTCENLFASERSIIQVCEDCGAELFEDYEKEVGLCEEHKKYFDKQKLEEGKHPDER